MEDRSRHTFLLVLLGVMAGVTLVHTGYATPRDAYLALERVIADASDPLLSGVHGPLEGIAARLLPFVPGSGPHWLAETLSILALAGSIGAFGIAIRRISGSGSVALLAAALMLVALQNSAPFSLIASDRVLVPLGIALFWLAVERWWRHLDDPSRSWVPSAALFALATLVHLALAACVVLFPAVVLLRSSGGVWRERLRRAVYSPHLVVALLAVMTSMTLQQLLPGPPALVLRDGAAGGGSSGAALAARALVASLPLSGFAASDDIVRQQFLGFGNVAGPVEALRSVSDVAWVIKALLAAALIVELARASVLIDRRRLLATLGVLLLMAACAPVAFPSARVSFAVPPGAELTGYLGLFGVALIGAAALPAGFAWVPSTLRVPAAAVLALGIFGLSYATDLANAHAAAAQRRAYDRQRAIDVWLDSEAVRRLPEEALIVAPTLFDAFPGAPLATGYWTRYIEGRLDRRISVFRDEASWRDALARAPQRRVYLVRLAQEARDRTLMLVMASGYASAEGELVSEEAALLTHGLARDVRITGRLRHVECRGRIVVDGVRSAMTFGDRFVVRTRKTREHRQWFWTYLSSEGALLEPESIVVSHHLGGPEEGDGGLALTFDSGFAEPEAGLRWAAEQATLTVENRSDRAVPASVTFRIAAPAAPESSVTVSGGEAVTRWDVGASPKARTVHLQLPPRSRTPIVFDSDAPAVTVPTDVNRRVLVFEELQVRDESCKAAGA
jgi:hypothetical protein